MGQSLTDALADTTLIDTEARLTWLEQHWSHLPKQRRSYAMTDVAMRLGWLAAKVSRADALDALTERFRALESSMLVSLGRGH